MPIVIRSAFLVAAALLGAASPAPAPDVDYRVTEGENLNLFVRDGKVAAHILLRSSDMPRILVAFPAGDSGVGLWFDKTATAPQWRVERDPVPTMIRDARGRPLYGVRLTVSTDVARLVPRQAVLSSIRYLRDFQAIGRIPAEVAASIDFAGDTIEMHRDRIDGAPGYRMTAHVTEGHVANRAILAGPDGRIALEITAATGETPLTPLPAASLLTDRAAPDKRARDTLRFLSYREKFLAGSWRFDTYFGRDTLMSVRLLMPVLQPLAIESGLGSVLARVAADGEVAHEEGIGEFAVIDNRKTGRAGDAATLDYGMVDGGYMLAPVAAAYLLDRAEPAAARRFLAADLTSEARPGSHEAAGALLVRNLRLVLRAARPFAGSPKAGNLVAIKPGRMTGQWRDSEEGLGRGSYAYDVNAVFVPAALLAAARLYNAGLLDPYLTAADRAAFADARAMSGVWERAAPPLFRVTVAAAAARTQIADYARVAGVPADAALAALGDAPLTFHALSLDANGVPIPVINSDEGFSLMFGTPAAADLDRDVAEIMRPFPAGLMTDVGLLVANPVFTGADVRARFTPAAYHGTVVWSWQQALLAAGLERQISRTDLPKAVRSRLVAAQTTLWRAIEATRGYGNSELWSWEYRGAYKAVAFGAGKADVDESNAAQLWSTVYLAVRPPSSRRETR